MRVKKETLAILLNEVDIEIDNYDDIAILTKLLHDNPTANKFNLRETYGDITISLYEERLETKEEAYSRYKREKESKKKNFERQIKNFEDLAIKYGYEIKKKES